MRIIEDFKEFTSEGGINKKLATLLFNPCFHAVCLYRLSNFFCKLKLKPIAKIIWYINRIIYNIDIDYRADLAGGFVLVHGLGTVIGKYVKSLGPLKVYQGVTLGGNNNRIRDIGDGIILKQPLIKKNVIIYSGAMIFGPVIIGDNVVIKAGSINTKDVLVK